MRKASNFKFVHIFKFKNSQKIVIWCSIISVMGKEHALHTSVFCLDKILRKLVLHALPQVMLAA